MGKGRLKKRPRPLLARRPAVSTEPPGAGLHVLNTGMGDVTVEFSSPEEITKAAGMIQEMLRQGFAVLLRVGEREHQRITAVDVEAGEVEVATAPGPKRRGRQKGSTNRRREKLTRRSSVVSVGRSAGG